MTVQVAVCGPRVCTAQDEENAYAVGQLLARAGATVLNGGGAGVMAAVSAGARSEGGLVIGILPGGSRDDANPVTAAVVTNMGEARNAILVASADAVIVVGGSWGMLSELALAMRRGVPVVTLGGWQVLDGDGRPLPDGPPAAATPTEAVGVALTWARTTGS